MEDVETIDPRQHGFRVDVSESVASSEAELANKEIDKKISRITKKKNKIMS